MERSGEWLIFKGYTAFTGKL